MYDLEFLVGYGRQIKDTSRSHTKCTINDVCNFIDSLKFYK